MRNAKAFYVTWLRRNLILFIVLLILAVICTAIASRDVNNSTVALATGTVDPFLVQTTTYDLEDNTGYNVKYNSSKDHPFGSSFASIYVDVNTTDGKLEDCGTRTVDGKSINQYGIVVGNGELTDNSIVDVKFRFNKTLTEQSSGDLSGEMKFNDVPNIGDSGWYLSNDSATSVGDYNNIGIINSGAVIVSKSKDGKNWEWIVNSSNESMDNYHTTDFVTGKSLGEAAGFLTEYGTEKFSLYTPSGEDISEGVYIKVLFAYEIKYATYSYRKGGFLGTKTIKDTIWHYRNILEETVFYIASNSATVAFNNDFVLSNQDSDDSEKMTQEGMILDGHGSLKGFRLNKLNNNSFTVKYRYIEPNIAPTDVWSNAEDGQYFYKTGRYDFIIETSLGDKYVDPITQKEYYSVFVNTLDVNGAVNLYFGNPNNLTDSNFITSDSLRVYSMEEEVPVYVAGHTNYRVNAVSPAYMPVAGKIYKAEDPKTIIRKFTGSYSEETGKITEPGNYVAEFYSNMDYEGTMSGDVYHFKFKFKVIDEKDVIGPVINEQLLNGLVTAQDLQGTYYSVAIRTNGCGSAIFAFPDYASAYGYAYEYERKNIEEVQGGYKYKNQIYTSQFDVLDKVDYEANKRVVKRYFDASDLTSFLTVSDLIDDVSELNIAKDIVVFNDSAIQEAMKSGEPFLNDRRVCILNEDGTISESIIPFKFIQVADYESNSVKLIHEATGAEYNMQYGVGVEQQLQGMNAPSGRYKIIEKRSGEFAEKQEYINEYYAIYIRNDDNTAVININTFSDGVLEVGEYARQNNRQHFVVNGFYLSSAKNENDDQTIVKVLKDGQQLYIGIMEEISDRLVYTAEGNYTVALVDRLGNWYELFFDIYSEVKSSTITFDNEGELKTQTVFDGQTIDLSTLTKEGYVFKGWSDGSARHNGTYTVSGYENTTLTAVWHYDSVTILVYDGTLCNTYTNNVEDKRILPDITKSGYELIGWFANFGDGTGRFYFGQISSVPNVKELRLDAVWKKDVAENLNAQSGSDNQAQISFVNGSIIQTMTATYGQKVSLPSASENGFVFFGWQYQTSNTVGKIYTAGQIESVPSSAQIVLYALFMTDPNKTTQTNVSETLTKPTGAGDTSTNGLTKGLSEKGGIAVALGITLSALFITVGFAFIYLARKKRTSEVSDNTNCANGDVAGAVFDELIADNNQEQGRQRSRKHTASCATVNWYKIWCKRIIPVLTVVLIVVLAAIAMFNRFPIGSMDLINNSDVFSSEIGEINNNAPTPSFADKQYDDTDNLNYTEKANTALSNSEIKNEMNFTEQESFLYSVILVDFITFGYDVFPATITKQDGTKIFGLGYSDYDNAYTLNDKDEYVYFGSGFVAFSGQCSITGEEVNSKLIITPLEDDYDIKTAQYGYVISFSETYGDCHYVSQDKYVTYGVSDYAIHYSIQNNDESNYNAELGSLYNYDLGRIVYETEFGVDVGLSAVGINSYVDYDTAKESFRSYIEQQNQNGLEVNTLNSVYISLAAYNEMILNEQDESFLGLTPEDIKDFESSLSHKEYYYVTPDGQLHKAEFPPPTPAKPSFWERFAVFATAIASIAIGVIILVVTTPCGGPGNPIAQMAAGAFFGVGFELFSQGLAGKGIKDVNWAKVGVAAVSGALSAMPIGGAMGYVVAGLVGGATDVAMKALDGEIDNWEDAFKTFAVGALKSVAIRGLTQGISKVKSKLGCFIAGTSVATLGGVAAIESLRVGDKVATRNATTGLVEYQPVKHVYVYSSDELTQLTLDNGETIVATPNHPFYVQNKGYINAEYLRAGDILVTVNGDKVVVEKIAHEILESPVFVYNLEVGDNHNYFVGDEEGILVHNICKYQRNYIKAHGDIPKNCDIHHQIPQKISKDYNLKGIIDVDDAKYLEAMDYHVHRSGSKAYNKLWIGEMEKAKKAGEITKEVVEEIWERLKNLF